METETKTEIPQDIQELFERLFISWNPGRATLWGSKGIERNEGYICFWIKLNPDKCLTPRMDLLERPCFMHFQIFSDGVISGMIGLPRKES